MQRSGGGTEELPEVRVEWTEPDFLERGHLVVILFELSSAVSLPDSDPIGGAVGGAGKTWDFHERFQEHRTIAVAIQPIICKTLCN